MFKNAWNLGTISGIKIRLHWSFLLLPIYVYYSTMNEGQAAALASVAFVLAVFGCVLLHELGHAFAARQFGIGTRDIILLPIGGVASLERMPRNPFQELWIAVAGPLVNVVIAIVIVFFTGLSFAVGPFVTTVVGFFQILAFANIVLVVFNMIPAFPMDGGRVFRSVLAMFMDYAKATTIAATVGKYCALLLGLYGLFNGRLTLVLLAGFVYLAGRAELMQVLFGQRSRAFNQRSQQTRFDFQQPANSSNYQYGQKEISVPATLTGDSVAAWLANMHAECCSIVDSGRVIGRMTESQLLAALAQGFGNMPIGQILMQRQN